MRALLVEHDPLARTQLRDALLARGHNVTEVAEAELALDAHEKMAYPLVIVGVELPRMGGLEFCRRIRALPDGEEPVIIVKIDGVQRQQVVAALDAGASDFVSSPIDHTTVLTRLTIAERTALERARRKLAEEALSSSEASFRALIEGLPDAIIVHRNGRIAYANPATLVSLGYERVEELIGRAYLDLIHTEERGDVLKRLRKMLATGQPTPAREERFCGPDGRVNTLEVISIPLQFYGEPGVVSLARDLTERKRMENQLMVADRMVSVGTLAAGIAHEINNPLAYVLSNLRFIADELRTSAPALDAAQLADLRELTAQAEDGAERVRVIVRDLKSFSRADEAVQGPVDIHRVLDAAVNMAWNEIRHRAQLDKHYGHVPPVKGNEAKLGQVFLNLLVNAAQSLPVGQAAHNRITITTTTDADGQVLVEVTDSGTGIAPEALPRVFDPFFTTKPVGVGTGLGLSICHSIVTGIGGDIHVASTVGEGTTITVSLRASTNVSLRPPQSVPVLGRVADSGVRILIVDDEPGVARSLRRALREHDVTVSLGGREALGLLRANTPYDLIFCDLMMPDVTGMDLYDEVARHHPGIEERMIFMTGGAFTTQAKSFLERIPNLWIEKPFDIRQVQDLVRQRRAA